MSRKTRTVSECAAGKRPTDYNGRYKIPPEPTKHLPGTEAKVCVLMERAARRLSLWHPDDAKPSRVDQLLTQLQQDLQHLANHADDNLPVDALLPITQENEADEDDP